METIHFRGTREDLRRALNGAARKFSGAVIVGTNVAYAGKVHRRRPLWPQPDRWPSKWWERLLRVARSGVQEIFIRGLYTALVPIEGLQLRVGVEALSFIREAFITKARGGTDEAGERWKPLSIKYIIYGRRHPGRRLPHTNQAPPNMGRLSASQFGKGRARRPALTKSLDQVWRGVFAGLLAKGLDPRIAAGIAWSIVKKMGGKTVWARFSPPPAVEINRDTGVLFNSLSPGQEGNVLKVESNGGNGS